MYIHSLLLDYIISTVYPQNHHVCTSTPFSYIISSQLSTPTTIIYVHPFPSLRLYLNCLPLEPSSMYIHSLLLYYIISPVYPYNHHLCTSIPFSQIISSQPPDPTTIIYVHPFPSLRLYHLNCLLLQPSCMYIHSLSQIISSKLSTPTTIIYVHPFPSLRLYHLNCLPIQPSSMYIHSLLLDYIISTVYPYNHHVCTSIPFSQIISSQLSTPTTIIYVHPFPSLRLYHLNRLTLQPSSMYIHSLLLDYIISTVYPYNHHLCTSIPFSYIISSQLSTPTTIIYVHPSASLRLYHLNCLPLQPSSMYIHSLLLDYIISTVYPYNHHLCTPIPFSQIISSQLSTITTIIYVHPFSSLRLYHLNYNHHLCLPLQSSSMYIHSLLLDYIISTDYPYNHHLCTSIPFSYIISSQLSRYNIRKGNGCTQMMVVGIDR